MTIAVCPRCAEPVQVPAVNGGTIVACPLCQSEYRLDEVLSKLPPTLRVVKHRSTTETPTVVMETDPALTNETVTVVIKPTPAADDDFSDEPPAVSFLDEPPLAGPMAADTDPVWGLHFVTGAPPAAESEIVQQPPALTSDNTEPTPDAFDFDAGSTSVDSLASRGLGPTMASRTTPKSRSFAVEFIKIALGGIAGLAIAQAILWWLPGNWRKDPFGLAPRLPSQLAVLAPADLRERADMGGDRPARLPTGSSGALREKRVDLQGAFEAAQADSRPAPTSQARRTSSTTNPLDDRAATQDATVPGMADMTATGQTANAPTDDSVDDLLGMRDAPSFSSRELENSLVPVESAVEAWVSGSVTDQEARFDLAKQLFEAFYQFAWKATFPDATAKNSVTLRGRIDNVLRMISDRPENVDLVGTAATSWLSAEDRSTSGILLSGTVRSIDAQGAYYVTTLDLSGRKKRAVTIVSRGDPSTRAQRGYHVGDKLVFLGAIVSDPSLDIVGYQGTGPTAIWGGPRIVVSSAPTDGQF